MDVRIVNERDNPFFKRKDLVVDIMHKGEATPKISDIKTVLAGRYNVDESQVVIEYMMSKKGMSESIVKAKIMNEKPVVIEKEPEKAPAEESKEDSAEKSGENSAEEEVD